MKIFRRSLNAPERLGAQAKRFGLSADHAVGFLLRPGVAAVVLEDAELVAEDPIEHASVRHPPAIASGRERARGERPVHEVEIGRAGVLVEAEGNLELA